jgi:hypothetical protein
MLVVEDPVISRVRSLDASLSLARKEAVSADLGNQIPDKSYDLYV